MNDLYRNSSIKFFYYGRITICLMFLVALAIPIGLNIQEYYEYIRNVTGSYISSSNAPVEVVNTVDLYLLN